MRLDRDRGAGQYRLMETDSNRLADADLRAAILGGLAAMGELETRFRLPLERYLAALCDRGDGRSLERAVEIASQVVADCFVKSPSLLERWKGDAGGLSAVGGGLSAQILVEVARPCRHRSELGIEGSPRRRGRNGSVRL